MQNVTQSSNYVPKEPFVGYGQTKSTYFTAGVYKGVSCSDPWRDMLVTD